MATKLNPYMHFQDNAREAMEFYKSVFGGVLEMNTFKEFEASDDPRDENKIMHAQLNTPNGLTLMGADTPSSQEYTDGARMTISLSGEDEQELRGYYENLCADGTVEVPLETAPWGDAFGMLTDKYGIHWMVNIAGDAGQAPA